MFHDEKVVVVQVLKRPRVQEQGSCTRAVGEKPKAFPPGPSAGTLFLHEWEFENRLLPRAPCFSHDLAVLSSASVQIQCPCQGIEDLCISFDVILYIKFLHLEKHKIVLKLLAKSDSKKKKKIAKKRSFFDPLKTKCTYKILKTVIHTMHILCIKLLHLEKPKIVFKLQAKSNSKKENIAKKGVFLIH